MSLAEMTLTGGLMILTVWLIRSIFVHKLPRRTFVVLWEITLLRLMLPWSFPSPLSVWKILEMPEAVRSLSAANSAAALSHTYSAAQETVIAQQTDAVSTSSATDPWGIVWLIGFLVCACAMVALYMSWLRRFAVSVPADTRYIREFIAEHKLRRQLSVRSCEYISAPLTYRTIRPVILLPTSMDLEDKQKLYYVLLHEYTHIKHFDALLKLLLAAVCCMHWFNPLVWIMYVLAARDIELACDENVALRTGDERASYARMLIQLEADKPGIAIPGINCSAGAVRERIVSIMKLKKKTALSLVAAGAVVTLVGTAFAASASSVQHDGAWSETVYQDQIAAESAAGNASPGTIDWWTAEEYEAWLDNEKAEMQSILGSKSWTPSTGEFVWTQERIDETIAQYEHVLDQIRAGERIYKPKFYGDDIIIQEVASKSGSDSYLDPLQIEEYASFGLTVDKDGLMYNGEKVRFFSDAVDIEPGITASKTLFYSDDGTLCLKALRQASENPDGSTDPFGDLIGIEEISPAEAGEIMSNEATLDAASVVSVAAEDEIAPDDLEMYAPFGLDYTFGPNGISMKYDGKPVHSLFDPVTGTWYGNNIHGSDLGSDRVDLEAVYTDGRLTGLNVVPEHHAKDAESTVSYADAVEPGSTFEEIFATYNRFGLYCKPSSSSSRGAGYNLFLEGRPVNQFSDVSPNGSAFSFESADQAANGLKVRVVYSGSTPDGISCEQ